MTRSLLVFSLFLAAPLAHAQATFGVKAGLNAATVTFEDDFEDLFGTDGVDKQPRLGLVAGVFADVALGPALSFRPEVLYAQRGYKITFDGSEIDPDLEGVDGSFTTKIDYLEVPLLIAYRLPLGQNGLALGLEAGPTLAYKLSTGFSCDGGFEDLDNELECDAGDPDDEGLRDYDVSGALGATLGVSPFSIGLRVTQGLTTIDDNGGDDGTSINARNRSFSVTARYSFGR